MLIRTMFITLIGLIASASLADVEIARDGKSGHVIVVANDTTAAETTAASELRDHLLNVTGAKLKIVKESAFAGDSPAIFVGQTRRSADVDVKSLGTDGIVIRTSGRDVILTGGTPRGTI